MKFEEMAASFSADAEIAPLSDCLHILKPILFNFSVPLTTIQLKPAAITGAYCCIQLYLPHISKAKMPGG